MKMPEPTTIMWVVFVIQAADNMYLRHRLRKARAALARVRSLMATAGELVGRLEAHMNKQRAAEEKR